MENKKPKGVWRQIAISTKIHIGLFVVLVIVFIALFLMTTDIRSPKLPVWFVGLLSGLDKGEDINNLSISGQGNLSPTQVLLPPGRPHLIAIENSDILTGPGDGYNVIGLIVEGQVYDIVASSGDGNWWVIAIPYVEGGEGWVRADRMLAQNVDQIPILPQPVAIPVGESESSTARIRALANVNIRIGPGLGYKKIGVLANGQTAKVVGRSSDDFWWNIKIPSSSGELGWISVDYVIAQNTNEVPVVELSPNSGIPVVPTPEDTSGPYIIAKTMLNIRSGPGVEYPVLTRIEPGQSARVLGKSTNGAWLAIAIEGVESEIGWVAVAYVDGNNLDSVKVIK